MSPDRRNSRSESRGGRDSRRTSRRSDSRRSDSRRGSRRDDRSRSSRSSARGRGDDRRGGSYSDRDDRDRDRDEERYPRGKSKSDTPIIVGGVVGVVVLIGILAIAFSGKKKPPPRTVKKTYVAPTRKPQTRDWYILGMREGYEWKRHAKARAPVAAAAGGGGNAFDPANVRDMADRMTSNWYNKGLRNNPEGQKRFMDGFCKAVLGK